MERPTLQGLYIKTHLHGTHGADENSFHNIDRLMRQKGFELFRMDPVHYSAAALPWPFLDRHPDQSETGRAMRGKALYMKDISGVAVACLRDLPRDRRAACIAKAAAVRALFGMPDQAADLLLFYRESLESLIDVDAGLDVLALQAQADQGTQLSYRDYIADFEGGARRFYNYYEQQGRWLQGLVATAREARASASALQDKIGQMTFRLRALETQAAGSPAAFDAQVERDRLAQRSAADPRHHWIFDCFGPWIGTLQEPAIIDFIGSKTSAEVGKFNPEPTGVELQTDLPSFDEEYFEWADVLEAVLDAGDTFTMLELGAGYGRWSARAALAARRLGKAVHLGMAEAEPKHIAWLQSHMARNGVDNAAYRIFPQAVAGDAGEVVFTVGAAAGNAPVNWFGQAIVSSDIEQAERVGDYHGRPLYEIGQWRVIKVPKVPLSQVLNDYGFIDLVDMDIQGSEAEALTEAIDQVNRKVRRLHIGTHGHDIEAQLRDLLGAHGWVCLQDYACHSTHDTPYGTIPFVDGVQSWINPRLWNSPQVSVRGGGLQRLKAWARAGQRRPG